jgi:hypothetical protein
MAEKTARPKQSPPSESAIAKSLVPDGEIPDQFIVFQGFPGRSNLPASVRLYLNEALDEYVEVTASDIRHSEVIQAPTAPLEVTKIWVVQTAAVRHTIVETRTAQADLIRGQINEASEANRFLAGSIMEQMPPNLASMMAISQGKGWSWFRCCKTKSHLCC